jgi:hypothetical protein
MQRLAIAFQNKGWGIDPSIVLLAWFHDQRKNHNHLSPPQGGDRFDLWLLLHALLLLLLIKCVNLQPSRLERTQELLKS